MAATRQSMNQLKEEVDENFLGFEVVLDGFTRPKEYVLVSEAHTNYARFHDQYLKSSSMADSRFSSPVEAWINEELFGDVVEASQQSHHDDEADSYAALRMQVDEYIEIDSDSMRYISNPSNNFYNVTDEFQEDSADLLMEYSPVDESEEAGSMLYYDEPQLWCFTA